MIDVQRLWCLCLVRPDERVRTMVNMPTSKVGEPATVGPGLTRRPRASLSLRDTVRSDVIEHTQPSAGFDHAAFASSARFAAASGPHHATHIVRGKRCTGGPRPMDRPQGKRYLLSPRRGDGPVRGQRHFPARQMHLQPDLSFDKKVKVLDPAGSGQLFANLRSGQYEFNELYGSVRAEVWAPEQSRTFSHKELVFPTPALVRADEKVFMANKRQEGVQPPSRVVECPPQLHQRAVLKNSSVDRYYKAQRYNAYAASERARRGLPTGGRLPTAGQRVMTASSVASSARSSASAKDAEIARLTAEIAVMREQAGQRRREGPMQGDNGRN